MIKPLKAPKALKVIGCILAVFLAIALSVSCFVVCFIGALRQMVTPESISGVFSTETIKTLDIGSMITEKEIPIGENTVIIEDGDTAGDIVGKVVGAFSGEEVTGEQLDKLIADSGLDAFINDKIAAYIDVFTGQAESAGIKTEEIKELFINNKDLIKETTGYEITEQDIQAIDTMLTEKGGEEILPITKEEITEVIGGTVNPELGGNILAGVMGVVTYLLSSEFFTLCIIITAVIAVLIFVCFIFRFDSTLNAYGYAALIAGIFVGLLPLIIKAIGNLGIEGVSSFIVTLASQMDPLLIAAAIAIGVGIVCLIVGKILKHFTVTD